MTIDQSEFRALAEQARHAGYLLRATANRSHPFTIIRCSDRMTINTFCDLSAVRDWLA